MSSYEVIYVSKNHSGEDDMMKNRKESTENLRQLTEK